MFLHVEFKTLNGNTVNVQIFLTSQKRGGENWNIDEAKACQRHSKQILFLYPAQILEVILNISN